VVDGWRCVTDSDKDWDDGTVKHYHDAVHEDGRRVMLDWSPYAGLSNTDFKRFVRLGFPTRQAVGSKGPLTTRDLSYLWWERFGLEPVWDIPSPLIQQLLDAPIKSLPPPQIGAKSN
jgi:hypothetical protein